MSIFNYMGNRGGGKTTAICEAAKKIGAIVLCRDNRESERLRKTFGVLAISVHEAEKLVGEHRPVLIDTDAAVIAHELEVKSLQAKITELSAQAQAMRSCIEAGIRLAAGWASYRNWEPAKKLATFDSTDAAQGEFTLKMKLALSSDAHRPYVERLEKAERDLKLALIECGDWKARAYEAVQGMTELNNLAEKAEAGCAEKDQRIAALEKAEKERDAARRGAVQAQEESVGYAQRLIAERDEARGMAEGFKKNLERRTQELDEARVEAGGLSEALKRIRDYRECKDVKNGLRCSCCVAKDAESAPRAQAWAECDTCRLPKHPDGSCGCDSKNWSAPRAKARAAYVAALEREHEAFRCRDGMQDAWNEAERLKREAEGA